MKKEKSITIQSRRNFIKTAIPACSLSCMGIGSLFSANSLFGQEMDNEEEHKFQKDWCMSYEKVFKYRYSYYIRIMKEMEKNLGKNNLLNMIKRANDDSILPNPSPDPDFDFSKYISGGKEMYKNMMTWDIIEETDIKYEIKATECLWAKVYREKDAGDLGFATVCYADALWAKSAHPNIKFTRTKTLMQGDSHCDHCWEFKR